MCICCVSTPLIQKDSSSWEINGYAYGYENLNQPEIYNFEGNRTISENFILTKFPLGNNSFSRFKLLLLFELFY